VTRIEAATRATFLGSKAAARVTIRPRGLPWAMLLLWTMPLLTVCGQSDGVRKAEADRASGLGAPKIDACQVLTKEQIETVQGESVEDIKASAPQSRGMLISQCLFRTATFAKSVSVTVGAPDPGRPAALTPREFWRQQVHPLEEQEEKSRGGGKALSNSTTEREEERKPRLIGGLGDEAYWVDNPIAGALYILEGETYVRISIGGVRAESARLEKTKALGRAAVKRLRSATASSRSSPDAAVSH
jgi:hypothetical protein